MAAGDGPRAGELERVLGWIYTFFLLDQAQTFHNKDGNGKPSDADVREMAEPRDDTVSLHPVVTVKGLLMQLALVEYWQAEHLETCA